MMNKPFLILNRLLVIGNQRKVYDETFHHGVNIIRGQNSSGKSTISEMIFYLLGGENIEWTKEAAMCDCVFGEFVVSGLTLSLRRDITSDSLHPSIGIAEGILEGALKRPDNWSYYGRTRGEHRESFSEFMFEHLGLPKTKSESSQSNITMYQVMRLIYADQNTDNTSIFRKERQPFADRQDIRRGIGEMLLGIDDLKGHDLRNEQIQVAKLLSEKKSRLEGLIDAAEQTDINFNFIDYEHEIQLREEKLNTLENTVKEKSESKNTPKGDNNKSDKTIKNLQSKLDKLNTEIQSTEESISSLSINTLDSDIFISTLQSNLNELLSANNTLKIVGSAQLTHCPICLTKLTPAKKNECSLCKSNTSTENPTGRLRQEQELKHQINESKKLLKIRKAKLVDLESKITQVKRDRNQVIRELKDITNPNIHIDSEISDLLRKQGYICREIEDLAKLESIQTEVKSLEKEIQKIQSKSDAIDRALISRLSKQEKRRDLCNQTITQFTTQTLQEDIVDKDNDSLNDAKGLVFSFEKDFLSVRHGRLSASTQAYLKNSFYMGLLQFSIQDKESRLPNFFILDNIEDKGMVPERFQNFHRLLIEYSEGITNPHQVIITTSYIDDELNNTKYCVGKYYDKPPYTLDLKGEWSDS